MISRNNILKETSQLEVLYEILIHNEIDLECLSYDTEINDISSKKLSFYAGLLDMAFEYLDLIKVNYTYEVHGYYYENFQLGYESVEYNFLTMSQENKERFGILNIFMILRTGRCISKKYIEDIYGEKLKSSKFNRIKHQIEIVTQRKILTTKDLNYCFEKEVKQ